MDPTVIITGISVAWNIYQSLKKRQYKKTIHAIVDGVEIAAQQGIVSPKNAIAANAAAVGVTKVLNDVLDKKQYRVRHSRSPFRPNIAP